MLKRKRHSKKGDGNATKKKTFHKGGRKCYKEEDIRKKGDGNATKKKTFQKGGRKRYKKDDIPKRGTEKLKRRR